MLHHSSKLAPLSSTCVYLAGTEPARRRAEQAVESAEGTRAGATASRRTPSCPRAGPDRARDQHDDSPADADADEADAGETQGQVQEESAETVAQVWRNDDQRTFRSVVHLLCARVGLTVIVQVNLDLPICILESNKQPANLGQCGK